MSAAHTIRQGHLGLITRDPEILGKGQSRSPKMEPLQKSYTTYY